MQYVVCFLPVLGNTTTHCGLGLFLQLYMVNLIFSIANSKKEFISLWGDYTHGFCQ